MDKMVIEFDGDAAREQAKHEDSDGYFGFLTGAEWQFNQLKKYIEAFHFANKHIAKLFEHEWEDFKRERGLR